ncbi:hypothetical protein D7Z94_08260 [Ulvibacterium marinum]|uniref:Carbohydrate-binding family 6 protein n=1 Tax=Ulvibacterium marinum TaxID=2419782 RepID=A0A3B0C900_9FLAO|nr:hypothetical protein D7Z94_08260 [Ulvibacterium marinum]
MGLTQKFRISLFTVFVLFTVLGANYHLYAQDGIDLDFALRKIEEAKAKNGLTSLKIDFKLDSKLGSEAYTIKTSGNRTTIYGGDGRGLLYGGLEVAEQIVLNQKIAETRRKPYLEKRGLKFNIPLDARTPSYDDTGDAAQNNILEMWKWEFWEEFLDNMALHRYNTLTLWNPHPFPSMIKMNDFPNVALEDVKVTTLKPIGKENEWAEPQMVSSNVMENLKTVKKITIDEKILFWKKVMHLAKQRGIDIYFITWNICPNSVAKPVPPFYRTYDVDPYDEPAGKYGISHQADDPETIAYYRTAVKTFLLTYPDIKGIGVTAGEHMSKPFGDYNREKWLWETYGQGVLDAKEIQPERKVHFIHRVWNSNMELIMRYWKDYPDQFDVSFKYAKARLYSSPNIPFADNHIEAMKPYGLKSWWNLRNDDIFVYRWGDAEYVREFLGNFPKEHTAAYHMGSDGYVWGREFVSKDSEVAGQLEIEKHWYNFMLWGRLGYDNTLSRDFFIKKLQNRFPNLDATLLYNTWQFASKIVPQINRFYWKDWDFMWSVESCYNERKGFQTVLDFMDNPTMEGSAIINPKTYVETTGEGNIADGITPIQVAHNLNEYATKTIDGAQKLKMTNMAITPEASILLDDILAMAYLGNYYAAKMQAATELSFFIKNEKAIHQKNAISLLEEAIVHWMNYADISETHYKSQMLARTKMIDWQAILNDVKQDIELAKNIKL